MELKAYLRNGDSFNPFCFDLATHIVTANLKSKWRQINVGIEYIVLSVVNHSLIFFKVEAS